jgi:hypothetical protein
MDRLAVMPLREETIDQDELARKLGGRVLSRRWGCQILHKVRRTVRCFLHWVFGGPFEELPLGFGKPMPEIRAFKEEMDDSPLRAWQRANAVRPVTRTCQAGPVTPMMEGKNGHEYQHTALGPW